MVCPRLPWRSLICLCSPSVSCCIWASWPFWLSFRSSMLVVRAVTLPSRYCRNSDRFRRCCLPSSSPVFTAGTEAASSSWKRPFSMGTTRTLMPCRSLSSLSACPWRLRWPSESFSQKARSSFAAAVDAASFWPCSELVLLASSSVLSRRFSWFSTPRCDRWPSLWCWSCVDRRSLREPVTSRRVSPCSLRPSSRAFCCWARLASASEVLCAPPTLSSRPLRVSWRPPPMRSTLAFVAARSRCSSCPWFTAARSRSFRSSTSAWMSAFCFSNATFSACIWLTPFCRAVM
mmetsp:Transcript_24359/g.70265  ORF Transcript_24359/g.70265 Transcript_24359/m.70265 type:complete len:289 (+) Transcript_24359:637-1503(+)